MFYIEINSKIIGGVVTLWFHGFSWQAVRLAKQLNGRLFTQWDDEIIISDHD